jgi:hypothetical protein
MTPLLQVAFHSGIYSVVESCVMQFEAQIDAEDRERWQALVIVLMNLWVP